MESTQEIISEIDNVVGEEGHISSQMSQSTQGIMENIDQLLQSSQTGHDDQDEVQSHNDSNIKSSDQEISQSSQTGHDDQDEVQSHNDSNIKSSDQEISRGNTLRISEPGTQAFVTCDSRESEILTLSNPESETKHSQSKTSLSSVCQSVDDERNINSACTIEDTPSQQQTKAVSETNYCINVCEDSEPVTKRLKTSHSDSVNSQCELLLLQNDNLGMQGEVSQTSNNSSVRDFTTYSSYHIQEFSSNYHGIYGHKPDLLGKATEEFSPDNYLRGCKWAPDGSCILTTTKDNYLRLYNTPAVNKEGVSHMSSVMHTKEGDTVYDYCWYSQMNNYDLESRCFVSSCRQSPIHMWDAVTGQLRSSYRAYNHLDEIVAAYSLTFSLDGTKLYGGFNKMIRVFDTSRPGRDFQKRPTFTGKVGGQPGIISCLAASPQGGGLYAAGSYSRGIALYYEPDGKMVCVFEGQQGGVTHIVFSPDGTKLYSGGRKDPEILCWDLRKPGQILFVALRHVETNQRIYFDQDSSGQYLFSANHNGHIYVWDTKRAPIQRTPDTDFMLEPISVFRAHDDAVNGVSLHPSLPLLATSSGQRHFPILGDSDSESDCDDGTIENSLKVWALRER